MKEIEEYSLVCLLLKSELLLDNESLETLVQNLKKEAQELHAPSVFIEYFEKGLRFIDQQRIKQQRKA